MTSNATCTTGNPATSNTVTMTVNPILTVSVSLAASSNPVVGGTLVTFTATPTNGGTAPVYLWKVNNVTVTGATAATYAFTPVNGDVIVCILTSNAPCVVNNPATSNAVTMSVTSVPTTVVLQNLSITNTQCYGASQTITVAGGGTTFTVQAGGRATMVAGQKISYLPGTVVKLSGYMRGYITTNGQYCTSKEPAMVATGTGEQEEIPIIGQGQRIKIYPNPTTGNFTLELSGYNKLEKLQVEIYGMTGEKFLSTEVTGETKREFSLLNKPVGIYLIQVISTEGSVTSRIIKK